ncbi:MAG TPA: hypothetical protein VIQ30_09895 [Pseudonocardia sp.]
MCTHRTAGRWHTTWTSWLALSIGSFAALEVYGLVSEGADATLSHHLRRRAGLLEPCPHTRLGRAAVVGFSAWLAAHIGFGRCGWAPARRTSRQR